MHPRPRQRRGQFVVCARTAHSLSMYQIEECSIIHSRNIEGVLKFRNWVVRPRSCPLVVCGQALPIFYLYRISSNSSRASNKCRASNTGRGSEPFVPIDAGGFYSRKYGISNVKVKGLSTTKIEHIFDASVNWPCDLDLLILNSVWESRVTWHISMPILVFLGLSVFDLCPMHVTPCSSSHYAPLPSGSGDTTTGEQQTTYILHYKSNSPRHDIICKQHN